MANTFSCIDLLTGIGGMALALHGMLRPICYCEKDIYATQVIQRLMRESKLPFAPILPDVRYTDDICELVGDTELDLVIATPSCKGFSVCNQGSHKGLDHEDSSLISCVVQLVARLKPHAVFLENVPGIRKDLEKIQMDGYALAHGLFSAEHVGAPHLRKRWYGLYIREGSNIQRRLQEALRTHECYRSDWSVAAEPQHIIDRPDAYWQDIVMCARLGMCGNAAVPLCAHNALCELVGAPARMGDIPHPRVMALDATLAETPRKSYATQPAVEEIVVKDRFPTPRYFIRKSCNRLTARTMCDLPTFLRFWTDVQGPRLGLQNPEFGEWLMGFPQGWTDFDTSYNLLPS